MTRLLVCSLLTFLPAISVCAQEYRVEVLEEAAKAEGLGKEIASLMADKGLRVIRGSSRTVCDIWPCKKWDVIGDFKPTSERLYPFKPGQLIGLLHFRRRGKDFRDQTVSSGWYTLRYGLQPTDGNHEGTSPTRDFLLLVPVEQDKSQKPLALEKLLEASIEAAGGGHPAMLCLQQPAKEAPEKPKLRHVESTDWWIMQFAGTGVVKGKTKPLPVDLVVAGHADE